MNTNRNNQASKQELTLYYLVGESLSFIQHLEEAISHSIAMKTTKRHQQKEAEALLDKYRKYTMGKAIKSAKELYLYSEELLRKLEEFLTERNWLVHRSIAQNRSKWELNISRDKLMKRIKGIAIQAHKLQQLLEEDLIQYAEANGADMSRVRAEIKKHYSSDS